MSQDVIDHLDDDAARAQLPAREQAVLRLAEQTTHDAKRVSDAQWNELRQFFAPEEIMELIAVAGLFAFFNRMADAYGLDYAPGGWRPSSPAPASVKPASK